MRAQPVERAAAAVREADAEGAVPVAAAHEQGIAAPRVGGDQRDRPLQRQARREGRRARLPAHDGGARRAELTALDAVAEDAPGEGEGEGEGEP